MITKDVLVTAVLEEFPRNRVLVIGDLMVDEYVMGTVSRISPEAPVAVLNFEEKKRRAGGAANVAVNVGALGASVIACGIAGQDDCGTWLRENLGTAGIITDGDTGRGGAAYRRQDPLHDEGAAAAPRGLGERRLHTSWLAMRPARLREGAAS